MINMSLVAVFGSVFQMGHRSQVTGDAYRRCSELKVSHQVIISAFIGAAPCTYLRMLLLFLHCLWGRVLRNMFISCRSG